MASGPRLPLSLVHRLRRPLLAVEDGGPPPLLILLHGLGSNELAMAALAESFDPRFLVISPRATVTLEPYSFAWFHMTFTERRPILDVAEIELARMQLAGFIDEAVAGYGADPERVLLAGFSQGSVPAIATLLTEPERVRGVVCMSSWLPPELLHRAAPLDRLREKPVLIVHGRDDATLQVALGREAFEALEALSLDVRYVEFAIGHTTTPESLEVVSAWLTREAFRPRAS